MNEIPQLALAKQFLDEAERHLQRGDDFGNGQAVSLAQDAVELTLRAAIRHTGVQVKARAAFSELIEALDRHAAAGANAPCVPHRARVEDVNQARVSFKHYGTAPAQADSRRLVRYAMEFAEVATPLFFQADWATLSLADAIRDDRVRAFVKLAEERLRDGELFEAVVEAVDAVNEVERALDRLLPKADGRSELGRSGPAVADYLNGLRLIALAALVHFDARALLRFRSIGVWVHRSPFNQERGQVVSTPGAVRDGETAIFAVSFARDFALAVQTKFAN